MFQIGRRLRALPLLVAGASLACTPKNDAPVAAPSDSAVTTSTMIGTLEARLSAPQRVTRGAPVKVSVNLFNRGDTTAALHSPGDFPFDVVVQAASNDTVWRYPPPNTLRTLVGQLNPPIAPGESGFYGTMRWDQVDSRGIAVRPGLYNVTAVLLPGPPWGKVSVGPVPVRIDP